MDKIIYDFLDYKQYLFYKLHGNKRSGLKSALAKAINCQISYLSRVMNGNAHFNLEQAEKINNFFGHSESEAYYFLLIVEYSRAATKELKKRLLKQIKNILNKRLNLKERFQIKTELSKDDQTKYFSTWYYSAIHVLLSIPNYQNKEAIAKHLKLSQGKVSEVIEFLLSVGLAKEENGLYKMGVTRIHLGNDSPNILKQNTNWRLQALLSLDKESKSDLHYTSVVSISKKDAIRIKEMLIKSIEQFNTLVAPSKEETAACLTMDFFGFK